MKATIRLTRCKEIITTYDGSIPLASHLKNYFSRHKEMGSNDRRVSKALVYNYFRLGKGMANEPIEFRLLLGNFLFNSAADEVMQKLSVDFPFFDMNNLSENSMDKFQTAITLFPQLKKTDLFPFAHQLSMKTDREEWLNSFFIRPLVWIRATIKNTAEVKKEFDSIPLKYIQYPDQANAFGFEPEVKITETQAFKKGLIEIQDISSQQTANYFHIENKNESWWDCCAGSGGKSLLLLDRFPEVTLTVSDTRLSILEQLKERFRKTGIKPFQSFVADLSYPVNSGFQYDTILVDAPCSGSGTWNRTPEMLSYFSSEAIGAYAEKQKLILKNVVPSLKKEGKIIYITCSVFAAENEDVVDQCCQDNQLICIKTGLIPGFKHRADTLFVAELRRK